MRKKLIGVTLVILVALAAALVYLWVLGAKKPLPAAPAVAAAPVVAPVAAPPEAAAAAAPGTVLVDQQVDLDAAPEEGAITQTLSGRDFTLQLAVNGNEKYRDLSITMSDGTPVTKLHSLQGTSGELSNITFAPGDTFELSSLIPGQAREQIVCKGSDYLMGGEGTLETFSMYRIDNGELHELISVITGREREEGNGPPAQKLAASATQTTQDGTPAIIYRVKAGDAPERTITFLWNGKQFVDASGEYKKLDQQYRP